MIGLIASAVVLTILKVSLFFTLAIRSSKNLHNSMFGSVLGTRIRFFDLNPLGRVINRFSKDIGLIDDTIPMTCLDFGHVNSVLIWLNVSKLCVTLTFLYSLIGHDASVRLFVCGYFPQCLDRYSDAAFASDLRIYSQILSRFIRGNKANRWNK